MSTKTPRSNRGKGKDKSGDDTHTESSASPGPSTTTPTTSNDDNDSKALSQTTTDPITTSTTIAGNLATPGAGNLTGEIKVTPIVKQDPSAADALIFQLQEQLRVQQT